MAIITLTTDFGDHDPYVGIMKGVILRVAPSARIVDLTHQIPPQNIEAAAFALESARAYFPPDTVHLAVVDPGVGSDRRPILVIRERERYVGPDNGLFSFALAQTGTQAWVLDRPAFWLQHVSHTFHGRDIFAPVAAHLARGVAASDLGTPISDPVRRPPLRAERLGNGEIRGHVIHVDRFGNLMTDIPGEWLAGREWTCEISGTQVRGPSLTYAAASRGELLLLVSSNGTAEIAAREASAAQRLGAASGTRVRLWTS
jgi:S-adenosyl-L-methionine hydrolase (adenosine-forming)